ncbi:MAG: hypothetical protein NC923_02530, partial [Candidatus Omnitrophica bacterium]|nr:hypothetical protein [Candidatus Omnitrophota bacterium]
MKELSKQEWMEFRVFPLNEAYKLLILQVYSGIKNSANFDGVSSGDTELCRQIVAFLESLGIYFHVLHKNDKLKIIFGNRKADVRMLCALQDKVFNENRWHYEYGRLLG